MDNTDRDKDEASKKKDQPATKANVRLEKRKFPSSSNSTANSVARGSQKRKAMLLKKVNALSFMAALPKHDDDGKKTDDAAEKHNGNEETSSTQQRMKPLENSTEWWPLPEVEKDCWHKKAPLDPNDWYFPEAVKRKHPAEKNPVSVDNYQARGQAATSWIGKPAPSDVASRGRGMGRGRDRTLPSWMTK